MAAARRPGAGATVTFLRATDSDVPAIAQFYASLSADSCRMRFFGSMPRASLEAAAELGGEWGAVAVLALVDGRIVGEARYLMHGDGEHEFAIAVADDCQHLGVGRRLLDRLRREAAADGIQTLRAIVRVENVAMLKTLRSSRSAIVEPAEEMVFVAEVSCGDETPGWPAASAGRRVLVESNSVWDDPATAAVREAGLEVRGCLGPASGHLTCPLLRSGRCRLAEEADVIACLLSADDPVCREVARLHSVERPGRLVARSASEWRSAARRLVARRSR
jgi:ribosomal protein S18 acetylase RimI-like enzyme